MRLPVTSSPRARRRLARWSLAAVAALALGTTAVLLPEGKPLPPDRFSAEPATLYEAPRHVRLTAAEREQISDVLERFVQGGLGRRDPADAWQVASSSLRAGQTLADWKRGAIPVTPYDARPGDARGWRLAWAYPAEANVEVFLHPGPRERLGPIAFYAGLKKERGRWLVDSLQPSATFSRIGEKPRVLAQVDFGPGELGSGSAKAKLGAAWLLLPAGLLALVVLAPIAIVLRKRAAP
jgi:hypothetical protein